MSDGNQQVRDIFEALIRFAGLLISLYGFFWLLGVLLGSMVGFSDGGEVSMVMLTPGAIMAFLGIYMVRGAPQLMKLVFGKNKK